MPGEELYVISLFVYITLASGDDCPPTWFRPGWPQAAKVRALPVMLFYFVTGLAFEGLGLAAYLRLRQDANLPLRRQLPWLAAFGFASGATAWVDMFLASNSLVDWQDTLILLRMILQPVTGLLLLKFGWGILRGTSPLPSWAVFAPSVLIVPLAFVIAYASTTFITPSPIEIPIDIWSRYLLYLPGSVLAGIGFMRHWHAQRESGYRDVASLMLGAGMAFLFEAVVVGLIVPAAPYGPASYYNYNRVASNAFVGEQYATSGSFGMMTAWLDYERILLTTRLPIEFWRMLSALLVTLFVVRSFGVFDAILRREVEALQDERDRARRAAFQAQIAARQAAEGWTDALVSISRRIAELDDVDRILLYIVENTRRLLESDFTGLALAEGESGQLELKYCSSGSRSIMLDSGATVENQLIWSAFRTSVSYRSQENDSADALAGTCFFSGEHTSEQAHAVAVVPLDLDNQPIGAFWIARFQAQPYSDTDLIWLECLADQVVIAIKHGLMTAQLQSLSITEERGRIAREMHDGLAQVLGYLNLQVQTLEAFLKQGKQDKVQAKLAQMREAVQVAHADVRENILSLRTTLASEKGMIPSVAEYLEEFSIQTKIDVQFIDEVAGESHLSSVAEVQLVCILQEALSNVRKHSGASRVTVHLLREGANEDEQITMLVADDGTGFVSSKSKRSFGLQTMLERAHSVGGELVICSAPGAGTQIECRLPCIQPERLTKRNPTLR